MIDENNNNEVICYTSEDGCACDVFFPTSWSTGRQFAFLGSIAKWQRTSNHQIRIVLDI